MDLGAFGRIAAGVERTLRIAGVLRIAGPLRVDDRRNGPATATFAVATDWLPSWPLA